MSGSPVKKSSIHVPNAASGAHQQIESFLKTVMQGLMGQETQKAEGQRSYENFW